MKKILYSRWIKVAAIVVFMAMFYGMGRITYDFLLNSAHNAYDNVHYSLQRPVNEVLQALNYGESDKRYTTESVIEETPATQKPISEEEAQQLKKRVSYTLSLYDQDIDYYIEMDEPKLKLSNQDQLENYKKKEYHYILEMHDGIMNFDDTLDLSYMVEFDNARIYMALKDDYASNQLMLIEEQDRAQGDFIKSIAGMFLIMLLMLVYLTAAAGRTAVDTELHMMSIDGWYVEFAGLFLAGALIAAAAPAIFAVDVSYPISGVSYSGVCLAAASGLCGIALIPYLSLVRNIKNKTFAGRSLICRLCRKLWHLCRRLLHLCKDGAIELKGLIGKKSGAILAGMLLVYTLIVAIFGWFGAVIGFLAGCAFLGVRAKELDAIRDGVAQIRKGDFTHKIPECKSEDYRQLAQDINEIGEGMSAAVEEQLKAERMKTELVTNVSHDLKTPLTSIINYARLLEELELSPEEARDYVKIISKKGEQLKNLTSDLFDISRVQSGNEKLDMERLDAALLINQSLGEHDSELKASGLVLHVKLADDVFIMADGKKMSRVIGNLLSNVIKYTMKGTRVFIQSYKGNGKNMIEIKNISAYPIDFDVTELTERFVRGDKSRTEEGNGLGLAIAKSYTEACGGQFIVTADGDLFKVMIIFDAA